MARVLWLCIASGVLLGCAPPAVCAVGSKVGAVDLSRVLRESKPGLAARAILAGRKTELQREIDARKAVLQQQKDELEQQRATLPAAAVAAREGELARESAAVRHDFAQAQSELNGMEAQLTGLIFSRTAPIIHEIAQRDGYRLVIEPKQRAPLCPVDADFKPDPAAVDITDEVNERLGAEPR